MAATAPLAFGSIASFLALLTMPVAMAAKRPEPQRSGPEQKFDVASIRRAPDATIAIPLLTVVPDGGINFRFATIPLLMRRAFPEVRVQDIVGLPDWTSTTFYDISARPIDSRLRTAQEHVVMLRSLLADRFNLAFHWETHTADVFKMVIVRSDKRPGRQLQPASATCLASLMSSPSQRDSSPVLGASTACRLRNVYGQVQGDSTMEDLARMLGRYTTIEVIDDTGLRGYYNVTLAFRPAIPLQPGSGGNDGPSLFDAIREQLGLELKASRMVRQRLVVDRIERPTEN